MVQADFLPQCEGGEKYHLLFGYINSSVLAEHYDEVTVPATATSKSSGKYVQ